jgi:SAM-dependent methyltransferase
MSDVPKNTDISGHTVIYAGRFIEQVTGIDLTGDYTVLGKQDALPQKLVRLLDHASMLVFLDPLSFPFEGMTGDNWDVPMVVVLPSDSDVEYLTTTLGPVLFERLGFFDYIVTPDFTLWEKLRRRYCWAESQRILVASEHPVEVVTAVRALFEAGAKSPTTPGHGQHEAARYWHERDLKLTTSIPRRAVRSIENDPRFDKALYRVQNAALEPRFTASRGVRNTKVPLDVLEVGTGVGRWASSFKSANTRFTGVDVREDLIRTARANFPEGRFDSLSSDLRFPYDDESFDLVFSVTIMHHNPTPAKRDLLSEMWRVTRPGGELLFLEDFVFEKQIEELDVYPVSVTEFVELIIEATTGQVVLKHVESLQYPDEDLRRGGLISLLRLGGVGV